MIKQYGLDPDARLMMQTLKKDKPKEAKSLTFDKGTIILSATDTTKKKKRC